MANWVWKSESDSQADTDVAYMANEKGQGDTRSPNSSTVRTFLQGVWVFSMQYTNAVFQSLRTMQ